MPIKVATLGPKGTFSEKAVLQHWKENAGNVEITYAKDFSEIFELVEQQKVEYGVFPLEDDIVGDARSVTDPLELLRKHHLYLVGEEIIDVVHCLLGKKGLNNIKVVVSHPQVLLHCQRFLKIHLPEVEQRPVSSTAEGAHIASENPTYAAIGSEDLAETYGLNVLSKEVHDNGINNTRFGISKISPIAPSSGDMKTSIIVYPKVDLAGVLVSILEKFAEKNINLSRIASRPLGGVMGEYLFYIDFETKSLETKIEVLEKIKKLEVVESLRDLGSYSKFKKIVVPCMVEKKVGSHELLKKSFAFWDNDEDRDYDSL